jgi:perosamine synthetase
MSSEVAPRHVIPLSVPTLCGREWEYVKECLDTNWVSSAGEFVTRFERDVAAYVGRAYAVATVNGTAALHAALAVAGVEADDEVLLPALTFIAPANAVRYLGAWPVFVDVEPDYWQLDPGKVADFLRYETVWRDGATRNRTTGRRIRAIVPVDTLGHPADLDPILELARSYHLRAVEDATESLGARYKGRPVGALSDIACFSFNGNKIVTTGGGGMIVTDDPKVAERVRYLTTQAKDDPIEYVHHAVGFNYRLPNVLAAIGVAQLEQLDAFVVVKRRIAAAYAAALAAVRGVTPMREGPWATSTFWLFTTLIDAAACGLDSRALIRQLDEQGIQARPLWQPLHHSPAHAGAQAYRCDVADAVYAAAVSLPSSVSLTADDQQRVIDTVSSAVRRAQGRGAGV